MIAAVSPTSASSRSGTPAPRSEKANKPPARLVTSLDTTRPYCTNLRPEQPRCSSADRETRAKNVPGRRSGARSRLCDQTCRFQPEDFCDPLNAHRARPQDSRISSGEVDDRRSGLQHGRTRVEIDVDEITKLIARLLGVNRGGPA